MGFVIDYNRSNNKNNMWKFYSLFLFVLQAQLTFQLPLPLPLSLQTFDAIDERTLLGYPINTSLSDGWAIVYSVTPSTWLPIDNNTILPAFFNGTIGVTANLQVSMTGYYDFSFSISQSNSSTFSTIALSYNSIIQSSQPSAIQSNLTFSITNQYLNSGTHQLAIWLDNSLSLNSVSVSQTVKVEYISVQLYSHPYYNQLYLLTNLTYASVTNLTLFDCCIELLLSFNPNAGDVCFHSLGAPTNPANFSSYSSSTNFTELKQFYSYTVSPTNTSILPNASGFLMITVSNISFDCSVIANINFPQGQIFNDGFWTVFSIQVDPVVEYIETILSQVKNYSFLYNIRLQRLEIRIFNLIFNQGWNIKSLNETTSVTYLDGGVCNISVIWYWMDSTTIFCSNTTNSDNISQISINLPDYYLRQSSTNRLYNITLNQSQTEMQYVLSNNASAEIKYYELESKLIVSFNIVIDTWICNLTTNNINITINGISVLPANIFFISNPMNYVQVYTILSEPLFNNDSVIVSFNSRWNLNTVEGYHNVWNIINAYQVQFFYSQIIAESIQQTLSPFSEIFTNPLKIVQYYIKGWNFFAFSYFINSLINFQSLICMYYFMSFKNSLHYFRKGIYQALLVIQSSSNYEKIIQNIFNKKVDFSITKINPDPLSLYKNEQKQLNLSQLGYTVQFFNNNFQSILSIFFLSIKLLLLKLLAFICFPFLKKIINYILHFWKQIVLVQFIMMSSSLSIVFGSYLTSYNYFGFSSGLDKLNLCLNILSFVLCIFCLFLLPLCQITQKKIQFEQIILETDKNIKIKNLENMENIKQNKENIKLFSLSFYKNRRLNKTYNKFLDNSLYIIVPFFMAADNTMMFILTMSVIVVYRLIRVIRTYAYYTKGQFLKEIVNKAIWVLFNAIYVFYWLTEMLDVKCDEGVMLRVITFCDIAESVLLLTGVGFEMISTLVQISQSIYYKLKQGISEIKRSNKISEKSQINPGIKTCKVESTKTVIDKNSISNYIKKRKSRLVDVQNRIKTQKQNMNYTDSQFQNSIVNKLSKIEPTNKICSLKCSQFDNDPKIGHLTQKLNFQMNSKITQVII